jgi:hypothetical protein
VQGHAYSILRVVSTTDAEEKEIRMLQIRNPWANGGALLLALPLCALLALPLPLPLCALLLALPLPL